MSRSSQRRARRQSGLPRNDVQPVTGAQSNENLATDTAYQEACQLVEAGRFEKGRAALKVLRLQYAEPKSLAHLESDLGTIAASEGDFDSARQRFEAALALDPDCEAAQKNLSLLTASLSESNGPVMEPLIGQEAESKPRPVRVALLSLLFNWPSTGGGTVHTAESGKFLARAGYDVQHIYACFPEWGLGNVTEPTGVPSVPLTFDESTWSAPSIQRRFREAVDAFRPDYVIITDSWNAKPLLAEAVRGYRYYLRLAALECLCPLNNVRLLFTPEAGFSACPLQQLATPDQCRQCVATRGHQSGSLHQAERELAGFNSSDYPDRLRRAFVEAEGILVVNPLIATMVAPFAKAVYVVPSGFDPERFPPLVPKAESASENRPIRLFFAGLTHELMKGFSVLQAACRKLWERRQNFELLATGEPEESSEPFLRYIGWQSQEALPRQLQQADILVFPTVAEEALGRSAVEAMGAGLPVIASRIGGLPFTVTDGLTGLLFEPGNVDDLAAKIETLLDNPTLRRQMGEAGRCRFEQEFTWEKTIDRHYRRLLSPPASTSVVSAPVVSKASSVYRPTFPDKVDHRDLIQKAAEFFQLGQVNVEKMFRTYQDYSESQGYARTLGEWKTLSFEESFLLGLLVSLTHPPVIVEVGTQHGKSTRRIVDLLSFLGHDIPIVCYDIVDQLQHVTADEVDLRVEDLTGKFRSEVLDQYSGGVIFVDTHGHALLQEIIRETADHFGNWSLAIHDCGRGLCNPRMTISPEADVTSETGVWERHLLAEAFDVADPLSPALDFRQMPTRRLRIFETQHGLALIVPRQLTGELVAAEADVAAGD